MMILLLLMKSLIKTMNGTVLWYMNGKGWISSASIWDPRWASYPVTLRLHRRRKVRRRNAGLELNQNGWFDS